MVLTISGFNTPAADRPRKTSALVNDVGEGARLQFRA